MSDVTVLDQIKKFVELQKLDVQIYEIRNNLKEKPAYLEELKKEFEKKRTQLNELEEKAKAIHVARSTKESELASKDDAIAKANTQLSQIKTNKEYTAKITEIENIKADKSIIEEQILASFDESDAVKEEVEKEKSNLADEEKKFSEQKQEIESSISEMGSRIKILEEDRSQIVPGLDKNDLERYERILANKEGLAIVPVKGQSCGGCFMNVPVQVINEIKMHEKLIYCEMCARILYIEDDVQ